VCGANKTRFFSPGYAELEPSVSSSAASVILLPEQAGLFIKLSKLKEFYRPKWRRGRTPGFQLGGQGFGPQIKSIFFKRVFFASKRRPLTPTPFKT
jgi:hypothetical protein